MLAAFWGKIEVVRELLKRGAKKELKNKIKTMKKKIKDGEPLDTDEENFAIENKVRCPMLKLAGEKE